MNTQLLLTKALQSEWLSIEEGTYLFKHATLGELMAAGHALRQAKKPGQTVTWIIDRNSNTTNVCVANCKFCNFYRVPGHSDAYITSLDQYKEKIEELFDMVASSCCCKVVIILTWALIIIPNFSDS